MKKVLLAGVAVAGLISGQAFAADLPPRVAPAPIAKAPVMVVPAFSWTGFYLGGNLGAAWAQGGVDATVNNVLYSWDKSSNAQFILGGQMGVNYQINSLVLGIEGDFDWTSGNKASGFVNAGALGSVQAQAHWNWMTTIAGRVGFAVDRSLFYVKGGWGWSRTSVDLETTTGAIICCGWGNTNSGWLLGGGFEYAFTNNWSAKLEYDYLNLQHRSFAGPISNINGNVVTFKPNISMVKVGVNYRFGGGAY
jgi:outer membrane immunogenic protein